MVRYADILGGDDNKEKEKDSKNINLSEAFKKAGKESVEKKYREGKEREDYPIKRTILEDNNSRALYAEMLNMSISLLKRAKDRQEIERGYIESTVEKVVDRFRASLYNPLLLYFYYHSEKSYLVAHIANDVILTIAFAASLGFSRTDLIRIGTIAYCHDIGMIYFKELFDEDKKLSSNKRNLIKDHPGKTVESVKNIFNKKECSIIYDVHEVENGSGYPFGKEADDIEPWAEVIAICDVYEALTHKRAHRDKYSPYDSMKMMIAMQDKWLKKAYVKRFVDFLSICPVGSLVYLNTGEVAVVIESSRDAVTKPVVEVIMDKRNNFDPENRVIDLSKTTLLYIKKIINDEDVESITKALKMEQVLDRIEIENCSAIAPFSYLLYGGQNGKKL